MKTTGTGDRTMANGMLDLCGGDYLVFAILCALCAEQVEAQKLGREFPAFDEIVTALLTGGAPLAARILRGRIALARGIWRALRAENAGPRTRRMVSWHVRTLCGMQAFISDCRRTIPPPEPAVSARYRLN
jgi:hypothetical protein